MNVQIIYKDQLRDSWFESATFFSKTKIMPTYRIVQTLENIARQKYIGIFFKQFLLSYPATPNPAIECFSLKELSIS